MAEAVIKVENLSKAYQIGQIGTGTLSKDIDRIWQTKILRKEDPFLKIGETNDRSIKGGSDIVWSLKDINFNINQGDAVGIIGKNGAGKSTLLKLLSRVTSPTTGSIKVKGRIASLLEVGTGFHPELSGRENIYLNGAILGMRKKEITRKLDEIIDFSGVERYIDTPVKRYSSGMYVRLAFAVAAHLESEILIVDEVLAVGDAEFQKKCLGKMGDISKGEGRTVLFVSHNMSAVKNLCTRGILLRNGTVCSEGAIEKVITDYLSLETHYETQINDFTNFKFNSDFFVPIAFGLLSDQNEVLNTYAKNDLQTYINIKFQLVELVENFNFGIAIYDINENLLFWSFNTDELDGVAPKLGMNDFNIKLPINLLNEGEYYIHFIASVHNKYWIFEPNNNAPCIELKIAGGLSKSKLWVAKRPGILAPTLSYYFNKKE